MNEKNQNDKTPAEAPTKKIPHDPSPMKDPDLTPSEDNPINPKE